MLLKRGWDAFRVDRVDHLVVQLVGEAGGTADVGSVEGVRDGVAGADDASVSAFTSFYKIENNVVGQASIAVIFLVWCRTTSFQKGTDSMQIQSIEAIA